METKVCVKCMIAKPISEFYPRRDRKQGNAVKSRCKSCAAIDRKEAYSTRREKDIANAKRWQAENRDRYLAYNRAYKQSPEGKAVEQKYRESARYKETASTYRKSKARSHSIKRWQQANRDHCRAIWHIWHAVKTGKLIKPDTCRSCGGRVGKDKIRGHHHNGYGPEHYLDVTWLCVPCHELAHHSPKEFATG